MLAQVPDHLARAHGAPHADAGSGTPSGPRGWAGEHLVQGRQVRQELALADIGVLRAGWVREFTRIVRPRVATAEADVPSGSRGRVSRSYDRHLPSAERLLVPAVRTDRDESCRLSRGPARADPRGLRLPGVSSCTRCGPGDLRARRHPRRCGFFVARFTWRQAETVGARPVSVVVGKDRSSVVPNKRASSSSAS